MEALVQLFLTLGLAILFFLAIFRPGTRHYLLHAPTPTRRTTIITDPDVARQLLNDHADAFSNRPTAHYPDDFSESQSINSVPYGPTWRALRGNLTAGILHPTRLGQLVPLQREAVEAVIANLSSTRGTGGEVVVRNSLHDAAFALTVRMCFGDGVSERSVRAMEREVLQFIATFVEDSALLAGSSRFTRLLHWRRWLRFSGTFSRVSKIILRVIADQQQESRRTLGATSTGIRSYVDSLLDLRIPDDEDDDDATAGGRKRPLTDKEIVRLVFEFLGANTESIVSCVEWTLAHLILRPEVQKKLHNEITSSMQHDRGTPVSDERLHRLPYLRAVILESLRLHAPVPVILRHVGADDVAACGAATAGVDGTAPVLFVTDIGEIGRSKKAWTDPDEFRPERFLAGGEAEGVGPVPGPKEIRMLPFGAGRRYCPGVDLGMVHVGCFLSALVREFEWSLPLGCDSIDMSEFRAFFMVMKTPLVASITPHTETMCDAAPVV